MKLGNIEIYTFQYMQTNIRMIVLFIHSDKKSIQIRINSGGRGILDLLIWVFS